MARDLADGVAVGVVGLLDTTVPLVTAARRIEESLERRAMNEPFALGNFQLGAEDVDGWGQARQQRLAPQNATTLHGDAERLVIFSVGLHELSKAACAAVRLCASKHFKISSHVRHGAIGAIPAIAR